MVAVGERLAHLGKFLDSPDPFVRHACSVSFNNRASTTLPNSFGRCRVKKSAIGSSTRRCLRNGWHLRIPARLLRRCADADLLAATIKDDRDEFRLHISWVMAGYLVLAGNAGLDNIDAWKLRNKSSPFNEVFSAMSAIHYLWTTGNGPIKKERLLASMRLLVDREEIADIAIDELTRGHDWGSMDRLIAGFDAIKIAANKRAIIRHVLACTEATPSDVSPEQRAAARAILAQLRKLGSRNVKSVERWDSRKRRNPPFPEVP